MLTFIKEIAVLALISVTMTLLVVISVTPFAAPQVGHEWEHEYSNGLYCIFAADGSAIVCGQTRNNGLQQLPKQKTNATTISI